MTGVFFSGPIIIGLRFGVAKFDKIFFAARNTMQILVDKIRAKTSWNAAAFFFVVTDIHFHAVIPATRSDVVDCDVSSVRECSERTER